MISYQAFMESYSKTQKPLNESREEYDPSSDIPEEYSLSYQEKRSADGITTNPRYTKDSQEEIGDGIKNFKDGIKRSLDSGRYNSANHSIEDINHLVSQKNLTPMHKAHLLSAMIDHNNALQVVGREPQPHEFATDIQEKHLFGGDFNPKLATLPKIADLHDDYVREATDSGMSETDRIFGSEAGYNRYRHG